MRNEELYIDDSFSKVSVFRVANIIYFFDDINAHTVCEAIKFIDEIEFSKEKELTFILNSHGGEEYSGLALYDRLRSCKCEVTMVGTGFIASMALIIYLAGDKRVATKHARFLNHQGSMAIDGKASDIKIESKEIEAMEDICNSIIAERTNQDIKKLKQSIKIGNKYIDTLEAKKTGITHEIISEIKKGRK